MKEFRPAILLIVVFSLLCGGVYPILVTGIAQALFPEKAQGSLLRDNNGAVIGSALIGQPFTDPKYFWPRPSATVASAYNPLASGGSNAGPISSTYRQIVEKRIKMLHDRGINGPLLSELVQASASGLDPHLSPQAVFLQVPRVAKTRGFSEERVTELVSAQVEGRQYGFLGEPRINVLVLNVELDRLKP